MAPGFWHKWDSEVLGYDNRVNEVIDYPVRWLGPAHRKYFHTLDEVIAIGYMIDGPRGVFGGISHLYWDGMLTQEDNMRINNAFHAYLDIEATRLLLDFEVQKQKLNERGKSIREIIDIVPVKQRMRVERIDVRPIHSKPETTKLYWEQLIKFISLLFR